MPQLKRLERQIANLEQFEITIRHLHGREVRGDRQGLPGYPYLNAAKNDFTVAQWREQRFQKAYPGFDVAVWNADGSEAHGATKLSTVSDSYLED